MLTAPDDIAWDVDREEFEELLATKREWAPDPDSLPYGAFRCAGGIGTRFLFEAYQHLVHGRPKSEVVDANGPLFRPPDARPRTVCNCDCKILTTTMPSEVRKCSRECTHPSESLISENETAASPHKACSADDSGMSAH